MSGNSGLDWATINSDAEGLLTAALAGQDLGMSAVIVNNTPFQWDRVPGYGAVIEPTVANWGFFYNGGCLSASNPIWKNPPPSTIEPATGKKSANIPVHHMTLVATTHLDTHLREKGGGETAIPYIAEGKGVLLIPFMALVKDIQETFMSGMAIFNTGSPNFSVPGGDTALIDIIHKRWMADVNLLSSANGKIAWTLNGTSAELAVPMPGYPGQHLQVETVSGQRTRFVLTLEDD
jgi:hypothetical protein